MQTKTIRNNYANLAIAIALGVSFTELVKFTITLWVTNLPQVLSSVEKALVVGSSVYLCLSAVFVFNLYITRQNFFLLGCCCGMASFVWFYVIKFWSIGIAFGLGMTLYSPQPAFSLFAFTLFPLIAGYLAQRIKPYQGQILLPSFARTSNQQR